MKPILLQDIDSTADIENTIYEVPGNIKSKNSLFYRKLFTENLIRYKTEDFSITADLVFNWGIGHDLEEPKFTWVNTRGFTITGLLAKTLSFNTELYENQAVFPSWPDSMIRMTGVVPGQGSPKPFKEDGFDYFYCNGYLSYSPSKYINMTLGYGKNFIGEGYRSMILSDVSFSYPYLKLNFNFKKFKYTVLYNQFVDKTSSLASELGYDRKWSTMHYLQIMLWGRLNLGLFDAIVWENADSNYHRGFDVHYLNPVIFLMRPVEQSIGSPDNSLVGLTLSLRINKHFKFYSQIIFDEFYLEEIKAGDGWWGNKFGYQLGISGWNLFNVNSLNIRVEYNQARPYTFSYATTTESYGHYNQPLAHPMGANFREGIGMASYTWRNWMVNFKLNIAMYGLDTAGMDFGKNIFIPYTQRVNEYGNEIGQGLKTNLVITDFNLAYLLNRRINMRLEAGLTIRNEQNAVWDKKMQYFYIGLRTGLRNIYYDF